MPDQQMEEMEGVEHTDAKSENPLLTEEEKRILNIYDRLEELQLEIALLKSQGILSQDKVSVVSDEDISTSQQELLKAKAAYQVRSNVVENVLITNPILKAVHAGNSVSIIEQDLIPLLEKRDSLSITLTQLKSKELDARNELKKAQTENTIIARKNAELAATMVALAKEANTERKDNINDPKLRQQLDNLEESIKVSRQRWRIMKATTSGIIVGSGVDWASDPKLLEIVLDNED